MNSFNKKLLVPISVIIAGGIIGLAFYNTSNSPLKLSETAGIDLDVSTPELEISLEDLKNENVKNLSSSTVSVKQKTNLTQTDNFAHDLLTNYMVAKSKGLSVDPVSGQNLVDTLLGSLEKNITPYKTKDLGIAGDSATDIKLYANNIAMTILNQTKVTDNESNIFGRAVINSDKEEILKLDAFSTVYEKMAQNFLNIKTPPGLLSVHLNLVNSTALLKKDVEDMRQFFNDSLKGVNGFTNYQKDFLLFQQSLYDIRNYLAQQKILFSPEDKGYLFVNGI